MLKTINGVKTSVKSGFIRQDLALQAYNYPEKEEKTAIAMAYNNICSFLPVND
ncbi:hypothetical protein [Niastella caeni]|uniref:hypothetical protein n=1 Tax=Niastella caeni TaxID=2569763 RepID=UPI00129ADF67|nr:hypothetical protein [Niastella caeni]